MGPGAGNELPQPGGIARRARLGLEAALHHGQQRDLERKALFLDALDDEVEVGIGPRADPLQEARMPCVPIDLGL